jgi:HSP20 family protein
MPIGTVAPRKLVPRVDVTEDDEALLFAAELPGVAKGDFEVIVDNDVVTIQGEKKLKRTPQPGHIARLERSTGVFSRSFRVPFDVDPDSVSGTYREGILTVTVPKPAAARARIVPVTAG